MKDPIRVLERILNRYRVTQAEVAADIGVTEATISRIINGRSEPQELTRRAIKAWVDQNIEQYPVAGYEPGGSEQQPESLSPDSGPSYSPPPDSNPVKRGA
jgi:transcriptional regulator with XRE-family HTH domain